MDERVGIGRFSAKRVVILGSMGLLLSLLEPVFAENPLRVSVDAQRVIVYSKDRPVLEYPYAEVPYKPYVKQFASLSGVEPLRDSPGDHKHHHALMFAVSVDGVNFWEEREAPGRQAHVDLANVRVSTQDKLHRAAFTEGIDWVSPRDKKPLLAEQRTIEVYAADDLPASLATWRARFTLPSGKASAELTGSAYFGLGVRFLTSMDTGGGFINSDGKTGVDGTNDVRAKWCAYSAQADGKPVTVVMFGHPDNPRHPATWFTMDKPFAYLSATLNLHKEALTLTADKPPLELRYGVAVFDGTPDTVQIEKLYRRWVLLHEQETLQCSQTSPALPGS